MCVITHCPSIVTVSGPTHLFLLRMPKAAHTTVSLNNQSIHWPNAVISPYCYPLSFSETLYTPPYPPPTHTHDAGDTLLIEDTGPMRDLRGGIMQCSSVQYVIQYFRKLHAPSPDEILKGGNLQTLEKDLEKTWPLFPENVNSDLSVLTTVVMCDVDWYLNQETVRAWDWRGWRSWVDPEAFRKFLGRINRMGVGGGDWTPLFPSPRSCEGQESKFTTGYWKFWLVFEGLKR